MVVLPLHSLYTIELLPLHHQYTQEELVALPLHERSGKPKICVYCCGVVYLNLTPLIRCEKYTGFSAQLVHTLAEKTGGFLDSDDVNHDKFYTMLSITLLVPSDLTTSNFVE